MNAGDGDDRITREESSSGRNSSRSSCDVSWIISASWKRRTNRVVIAVSEKKARSNSIIVIVIIIKNETSNVNKNIVTEERTEDASRDQSREGIIERWRH
ncbi:hypothetical protein ACS0PU_006963 [Formica fusca]